MRCIEAYYVFTRFFTITHNAPPINFIRYLVSALMLIAYDCYTIHTTTTTTTLAGALPQLLALQLRNNATVNILYS